MTEPKQSFVKQSFHSPAQMDGVEARLGRLERRSRRWASAFFATAAVFVVALLSGATPRPSAPDMLSAHSFSLIDDAGRVRGQWRLGDAGPELAAFSADGELLGTVAIATDIAVGHRGGAAPTQVAAEGADEPASDEDDDDFDWVD
jgi:hypothetical protein